MTGAVSREGQSQWQLIWQEFSRRILAVVCAAVIFLLIQTAIWAPFLANDRPIYYRGANRARYERSVTTCQGALSHLTEHRQKKASEPEPATAVSALTQQLDQMILSLAPADSQRLAEWRKQLESARAERNPQTAIKQFADLKRALRESFPTQKVTFLPQSRWPVLASLTPWDAGFMTWSLLTILAPVWRRLLRRLPGGVSPYHCGWGVWLGVPVLAGLLWYSLVPVQEDQTRYKQGQLTATAEGMSGPVSVVYDTVMWPPVPFGLSESVTEKKYQPPPWYPVKKSSSAPDSSTKPSAYTASPWDSPHWLGTDALGRDALSRMIWGSRVSLSVGFVSVTIYVVLGIVIGALAGFFRGGVDLVISRFIEIVICFPTFFLILTIVALRGPSIWNIMIVIGLTGWTGVARLIRAEFLRLVDQEFVLAGRALGYSSVRLIFRHILPNAIAPMLVSATFGVGGAILTESALSYLGLGITIPIPSWGSLLLDGRNSDGVAPWLILIPGLAIFLTITCYNLVGEALRDASDPRLRGSRS